MSSSRLGEAIDALVARATAVAGGQAAIVDGWRVTDDPQQKAIIIGWDGLRLDAGGTHQSTTEWSQTVAGLGNKRRDETFGIQCCIVCWTGNVDPKARRDAALTLLALLEDDLRADPSMGVSPQPFEAEFQSGQLFQEPISGTGDQARITFTVLIKHNRI